MSGPHDEPPVREVLLQHLDTADSRVEKLRTADLTLREVRDSLWLVRTTPAPPRPPAAAGRPTAAPRERPAEDPAPPEPPEPADGPPDEPLTSEPAGAAPEPDPDRTGLQRWTPTPTTMARADPVITLNGAVSAVSAWPTVPALPERRRISRALRPLGRRHLSSRVQVLDEEATAVRAVRDRLWLPEWRDAPWRRFEVALVVDTTVAAEIWRQTVREFRVLLERQGAFRDVRTYELDSTGSDPEQVALRSEGGATHHWRHLVDPAGNRIVLVLTDTIGRAWHSGAVGHVLHHWGRHVPVAVVQTLAQRLWSWGGLPTRRMRLSAPAPGVPNHRLRVAGADTPATPVPVLGLSAEWMTQWARLLTSGTEWVETTAALVVPRTEPAPVPPAEEPLSAAESVLRFRTYASVDGFHLAGLLAATPLSPQLMGLVQRVLLPGSDLSALAEVMLGGLMTRLPGTDGDTDAVAYDFNTGVREELLATSRRSDTARVARVLDQYAGAGNEALRNYRLALDDPDQTEALAPSAENLPYLKVQEAVFRALSGPYARRSQRIGASIRPPGRRPAAGGPDGENSSTSPEHHLTSTDVQPIARTAGPQPSEGEDMTSPGTPLFTGERLPGATQPQVWGHVPLRNPDFVGRGELLEQLRLRLSEAGPTAVLPEALHGMGGVGKSQTVVEYIHRHASEYEVVWWISAERDAQIKASFVELANKLGVAAASAADTAVPAVLEALRLGTPFGKWMLVFDNADRPQDVRRYFPAGSGHIVVTSRNSEWGGFARAVEVDLFTREESVELLHRRGGDLDDAEADALADALGDLPLAVEQAAAWRAQTGMQVSEYLELLAQNRTELLEAGTSSEDQLPVAAAWNVPLNRLKHDHRAALELLQVCAFFGPEPISQQLFRGVRDAPVPDSLGDALRDPIKLSRAVREISRYSLAKIDHRANALQLHRLVQTVLKNQLGESEQNAMRHAVHVLLVNGDPLDPESADNWPRYAELLPHALVSRAVDCPDRWVRGLVINLVRYLLSAGDFDGARELSAQAMESWRTSLGEREFDTLEITRRYGISLRRLGRLAEAAQLNERTHQLFREVVGDNHEGMLLMLDTIALDRRAQGQFAEELDMRQQVYDRAVQILGIDDPMTLTYANNLASSFRLMGDYRQALKIDELNLLRRTAALGPTHYSTLASSNSVYMDMRELGEYVDAARLQDEALVVQRELFGDDHPRIIGATRSLSVALRKAGEHERAKALSEDCLVRYRRRHGEQHTDTITARMNLATDLRHLGDLDGSLVEARRSYEAFQRFQGDSHPYTLIAGLNLAVTLRLRGEVAEALDVDREMHTKLTGVFDADHPFALVAATNLASDLAATGDHAAARKMDEDTLERSTRVLGAEHPSTLAVALNLAIDLDALGEENESAVLHARTVASFRKVLGDEHPATIAATQSARANCDTDTMQF
ncbi:FxSxx-COOH system tetratricopeptide repeat protein [Saccharothrix longispora]|uniref:Tetratricopeptide (TPR) repeat protein n=1 Tax=Saccharothrix longispora TaxID=33920 RepID=A0ABU1PXG2_9PSEU|nr:FxSxx-COOH system tetratricopeptide repeat protein [Saccharothrix longispora]MDR6595317.1 tetratricopeptide (TPR) repeat protein [Saccharothrix longispora]